MSQYIEIFVKSKENNFTCLNSFSRSTYIYRILSDDMGVPYAKIKKITPEFLRQAIDIAIGYKDGYLKSRDEAKERMAIVASFNNSVEEKYEIIHDIYEALSEYDEVIEEVDDAIGHLRTLASIADNLTYETGSPALYCGIEIGEPTLDDIVGE